MIVGPRLAIDADFTDVEGASSPEEAVSGMVDALRNGASMSDKDFYRFLDLPERRIAAVTQMPIHPRCSRYGVWV